MRIGKAEPHDVAVFERQRLIVAEQAEMGPIAGQDFQSRAEDHRG